MGEIVTMPMEIGYWKIRGLGAPLRMMAAYKDEEVTHYAANSGEMWFGGRKPELLPKNSLINLPFIVNGDDVVTQSNSCLLYLGYKLQIDKPELMTKNHQALDQIMDLRNDFVKICYPFAGPCKSEEEFPACFLITSTRAQPPTSPSWRALS